MIVFVVKVMTLYNTMSVLIQFQSHLPLPQRTSVSHRAPQMREVNAIEIGVSPEVQKS